MASSSSILRMASGVRSSWLASATKARSRTSPASRRASISLSVSPRRRTSSSEGGSGSRASGRSALIVRARRRIDSTGRSALEASPYAASEASTSASEPPIRIALVWVLMACSRCSSETPTTAR